MTGAWVLKTGRPRLFALSWLLRSGGGPDGRPRPRPGLGPTRAPATESPGVALTATSAVPLLPAGLSVAAQPVGPAPPEGPSPDVVALIERAQAGDADAFGEIYDRYVDVVYRYIYYRVGTSQLAEDLTSETFLRALRRISSFTWQGRDVGAWFVTIARNLIADHYKSSRYRLEVTTADLLGTAGDSPGESTPETEVLQALTNEALLAAVKGLGAEQQECVVLRFLQGMSVSETAQAMGKNEGAIKALQYRAVRSLGRLLPPGSL